MRNTWSFEKAFAIASRSIARREQKEGLELSNPQMAIGKAMAAKLSALEKRFSAEAANAK